ncbi:tyrosine-type recombinase/integrase [Zavarzinia aquatilis]|nr:tyrosine-type recombinase/integrase [Zavarzinia aquatilis]
MAWEKIRYFVERPGRAGKRRHFWQPSEHLRSLGWKLARLSDDREQALAEARRLNRALDDWRKGLAASVEESGAPLPVPAPLPKEGTVAALIAAYKASEEYAALAEKTRHSYRLNLGVIERWAGDVPVRAITAARVQNLYKGIRAKGTRHLLWQPAGGEDRPAPAPAPSAAAAVVRALSLLWTWGRRAGLCTGDNPAEKPGIKVRAAKGRIWTAAEVDAMVAAADRAGLHSIGTAIVINEWLGQREGDIIRLTRRQYRDGAFHIRQSKRGAELELPHSPRVAARVAAELARFDDLDIPPAHILISEVSGAAYTTDRFVKDFAKVRAAAAAANPGMAGLQFMHLRHTAVTRLFEAECELPLIASITGHTLKHCAEIIDRYGGRTRKMARLATDKRLAAEPRQSEAFKAGEGGE